MKKLYGVLICFFLLTIISSARIIEIADAGITDKLKAVIAAKNAVAPGGTCGFTIGDMIFACGWSDGTGITNADAANPIGTWNDGTEGTPTRETTDCFAESNCLEMVQPAGAAGESLREDVALGTMYASFAFRWSSESIPNEGYVPLLELTDASVDELITAVLYDDSDTLKVGVRLDEGSVGYIGAFQTVTVNTWYQIELKYINGGTSGWRLFSADGTQLYPGSGFQDGTGTTESANIIYTFLGAQWASYAVTYRIDNVTYDTTEIGSTEDCTYAR